MAVLTVDQEIGSAVEAAIAANFTDLAPAPETGWRYLGKGCSRIAFLSPTNVVYKVDRYGDDDTPNRREYEAITEIRESGSADAAYTPITALYDVNGSAVIAMESIPYDWNCHYCEVSAFGRCGTHEEYLRQLDDVMEKWGCMGDCHFDNVRFREDGSAVVIDWGSRY